MRIKTRNLVRGMVLFNVFFMLFYANLVYLFRFPTFVKYIPDLINLFLLFYITVHFNEITKNKHLRPILIIILLFLIHSIIGLILNSYSIINYLWGLRTVFKSIIIYFATYLTFDINDKNKFINIIHKVYIINFLECLFQYFILGWKGDYLGGIFSYGAQGGNGPLTIFIAVELITTLFDYMNKKVGVPRIIMVIFSYLIIAVLGELKFSFIIFAICILLSLVFNKKSLKTVIITAFGFFMIFQGINMLSIFFPNTKDFFSYDSIVEYTSSTSHGYSTSKDLSRIRAFDQINDLFFYNTKMKMFGFGLGNCSTGPILKLKTSFYNSYEVVLHYDYFTTSFVYLETGLIGFICLLLFFVTNIIEYSKVNSVFSNSIKSIVIILIMMIWYNDFLMTEMSYFAYVIMAIPFTNQINNEKGLLKKESSK